MDFQSFSQPERLAAVELAIRAIASRLDWKRLPPPEVTPADMEMVLPPMDVTRRPEAEERVRRRVYQLLGAGG